MTHNYEIDVLVRGKPVQKYYKNEQTFIEGRKNSSFELRIRNNTWTDAEIVVTVDGLSVINGKPGGPGSDGYLVRARNEIIIPGWRLNNDSVAEFVFCDKSRSYVSQMGKDTANAGVIGFMIFEEESKKAVATPYTPQPWPTWPPRPTWPDPREPWISHGVGSRGIDGTRRVQADKSFGGVYYTNSSFDAVPQNVAVSASVADTSAESFGMGTGWGDEQSHSVQQVEFKRKNPNQPTEILSIYYDSRKGLESRGIQVSRPYKKETKQLPNPFPEYVTGAKPPLGWKGRKKQS